jgi:hypothetical protein
MREGRSGIYVCPNGTLGYDVCMLDKDAMISFYRDPFLYAVTRESGVPAGEVQGSVGHHWPDGPWFTGYETQPRWMRLTALDVEIRCVADGFMLRPPGDSAKADAYHRVCVAHGIGADHHLRVPQVVRGDERFDATDRVQLGAALVRDLVSAGL